MYNEFRKSIKTGQKEGRENMLTLEVKAIMTLKEYTQEYMAKRLDMATNTFNRKLNTGDFGLDDAKKIAEILEITDPVDIKRIFF